MLRIAVIASLAFTSVAFAVGPRSRIDISGTYSSNWEDVTLVQSGDRVTGTYVCCGGGTIEGRITGGTLHYVWRQPNGSGQGVWTIDPDRLDGTWGSGQSEANGGRWDLVRKTTKQHANVDISGTYSSNWDDVKLVQDGNRVTGSYVCCGGGAIQGTIVNGRLRYEWKGNNGTWGLGTWKIDPNALGGTWGSGQNESSGGRWDLVRKATKAQSRQIAN